MLRFLIFFVFINYEASARFVTRQEWGARSPAGPVDNLKITPPPYVVIHHSAGAKCLTTSQCIKTVRNIQNYHINTNHWSDIGYNFLVGGDGNIYEGRGWGKRGAHAPSYNQISIGICLLGNYEVETPSSIMLNAVKSLISGGVQMHNISSDFNLIGHKQVKSTLCPGRHLFDVIKTWPHFKEHPSPN